MAEPHDVMEILRRARPDIPDELVSPGDPAAQALLEEILALPAAALPDVAERAPGRLPPRRSRLAIGGAAAAAALLAAALVAASVVVFAPTGPSEASPLAAAADRTAAALRPSGRADATVTI